MKKDINEFEHILIFRYSSSPKVNHLGLTQTNSSTSTNGLSTQWVNYKYVITPAVIKT